MVWLICVVVVIDVVGYFVGKVIGGKKFWFSISFKKIWVGIFVGWVVVVVVGGFMGGEEFVVISVFMFFVS